MGLYGVKGNTSALKARGGQEPGTGLCFNRRCESSVSIVEANPQYGKGGATQYFIEDFESKLKPFGDPIDLESRNPKTKIECK